MNDEEQQHIHFRVVVERFDSATEKFVDVAFWASIDDMDAYGLLLEGITALVTEGDDLTSFSVMDEETFDAEVRAKSSVDDDE